MPAEPGKTTIPAHPASNSASVAIPRARGRAELMAPAGNWISLRTALQAGADAVYFGVSSLNMRAAARNFTIRDLPRIRKTCDQHQARAYLTLNTIIHQGELRQLDHILEKARAADIDAIIAWDLAVIQRARDYGLPVHLSTQASAANAQSIATYHKLFNINRFVLARECTLADIRKIRRELRNGVLIPGESGKHIQLEAFAHGAMCVSISGRCFLSEHIYGKSGNRGECVQPCRREYDIVDKEGELAYRLGSNYILSPKDLCTLPFVEELIRAGIQSLKIEGRNRPPEYVHSVVSAYREAIDYYYANRRQADFHKHYEALKQSLVADLRKVYNRDFSDGFYMGQPIGDWTSKPDNQASVSRQYVGKVSNYYRKAGVVQVKVESHPFRTGDTLTIQGNHTGLVHLTVDDMLDESDQPVDCAAKGAAVTLKTPKNVRRNDKVYVLVPRSE